MKKRRVALIIVSWMVLASPALVMGAEKPQANAEKQVEPQLTSESETTGQIRNASEDQPPKNRAATDKRTRYGMGYESRRKNSRPTTRPNNSGRGHRSGRSKR